VLLLHGDGAAPDQAGRSCSGGWRSPSGSRPHGTVHLIYLRRRSLSPRVTARGWRAAAVVVSSLAPVEEEVGGLSVSDHSPRWHTGTAPERHVTARHVRRLCRVRRVRRLHYRPLPYRIDFI
jgi:hypothetical protein